MLDFESINKVWNYDSNCTTEYRKPTGKIKDICMSKLNRIRELIWKAEVFRDYESQQVAIAAINEFYAFSVSNNFIPAGKFYLVDKLQSLVDLMR